MVSAERAEQGTALETAYQTARKALESLYDGACTIYTLHKTQDPETAIVRGTPTPAAPVPCRLSYTSARPASPGALGAPLSQEAVLFTAPDNAPAEGSRILVTHRGRTTAWTASGPPAVYPTHAQTVVTLEQVWA